MSKRLDEINAELRKIAMRLPELREVKEPTEEQEQELAHLASRVRDLSGKATDERELMEFEQRSAAAAAPPPQPETAKVEKRTLGEYLQAVAVLGSPDGDRSSRCMSKAEARGVITETRATGMAISPPSDGGFLIGTQQAEMLTTRAYGEGKLVGLTQRIPISGPFNGLKYPVIDESSRADGSRSGGVLAYWANEGEALTKSKPKVRLDSMDLEKLTGLCYASEETIQDASALEALISDEFGKEFGFQLDDAILNGTGAGMPIGILNGGSLVGVAKETGQSGKTISFENVIKMYARHWAGASATASRWIVNREAFPQLMTMGIKVGTAGFPVFLPGNSAVGAPAGTLLGVPVVFAEQALALGTKGDIYLADLGQYRMIEKGGIRSAASMHVQFVYDEMVYRFILRTNGQPLWDKALTPYKGTGSTVSPFVALNDRA